MATKHFDLVKFTKQYKSELHEFFLDMSRWRKFKTKHKLDWQKLRFGQDSPAAIPKQRGIYVFTVELSPAKLPAHGYIMYVGETGEGSKGTLYSRYAQYLREREDEDGRPAVLYMMKNWSDHLFFNFAPLPDKTIDLLELESAFINSIIPPINKRDFEADIRSAKAAKF